VILVGVVMMMMMMMMMMMLMLMVMVMVINHQICGYPILRVSICFDNIQ